MITRRGFLKRLGGAAAAITLSPLLDFAPIKPIAEPHAMGAIMFKNIPIIADPFIQMANLYIINPNRLKVFSSIE